MIRKPDAAWGRDDDRLVESARQFGDAASQTLAGARIGVRRAGAATSAAGAAIGAAGSGVAALGAATLGTNLPMAMLAGSFSLGLGWLAVRHFRQAFGSTQPRRPAPHERPPASDMWRAPNPAAWTASDAQAAAPADTVAICYDRAKIFGQAAGVFVGSAVLAVILARASHKTPAFSLVALAIIGFGLWQLFGLVLKGTDKDQTAISWNSRQICVRTLRSSCRVPWAQLEAVTVRQKTLRLMRLIPLSRSYTLMFRLRHNGKSRNLNIPASALAIPAREALEIMRRIELLHAQYSRNPVSAADERVAGWDRPAPPVANPARRTQGFETTHPIPATQPVFGRKIT